MFFDAIRVVVLLALAMTACYVPVLALNSFGNGGYALAAPTRARAADFGMVTLGLGNQGLDPLAIFEGGCRCEDVTRNGTLLVPECKQEGGADQSVLRFFAVSRS